MTGSPFLTHGTPNRQQSQGIGQPALVPNYATRDVLKLILLEITKAKRLRIVAKNQVVTTEVHFAFIGNTNA